MTTQKTQYSELYRRSTAYLMLEQLIFDWMQELDYHIGDLVDDSDGVIAIVNEINFHAPGVLSNPSSTDPHDIIRQLSAYRSSIIKGVRNV